MRREAGASPTDTERNIKAFNKLRRKISRQTSRKGYFFKTGAMTFNPGSLKATALRPRNKTRIPLYNKGGNGLKISKLEKSRSLFMNDVPFYVENCRYQENSLELIN